jgi:hypothetical protein
MGLLSASQQTPMVGVPSIICSTRLIRFLDLKMPIFFSAVVAGSLLDGGRMALGCGLTKGTVSCWELTASSCFIPIMIMQLNLLYDC